MAKDNRDPKWIKIIQDAFAMDKENPYAGDVAEPDYPDGVKGGSGSGNFSHEGRPGLVGGSGGGGVAAPVAKPGLFSRFLDAEHPHALFISPTGQELDIPSVNWNEVSKVYLKAFPLIEKIVENSDFVDLYHVAMEQVLEQLSSPHGQAALAMIPQLFKQDDKTKKLMTDLRDAIADKDIVKAVTSADQLLALLYEAQKTLQDETQRADIDTAVTAMEQVVSTLGDDPEKVKEIWLKGRA